MRGTGRLLVLSAPSGGGKTTICEQLLRRDRKLSRSISATTRPRRGREQHGREYYFWNEATFKRHLRAGCFLEWAKVHGHYYGTLRSEIARRRRGDRDVILVIDVQGGLAVKKQDPEAVLIFVKPPTYRVLAERLRRRGTDSRKIIRQRLRNARWEMTQADAYDYVVVNHTLARAVRQVEAIITAERLRRKR
ncbi:MAG: guanylate kinase [candidate division FCPU426 bacterium]